MTIGHAFNAHCGVAENSDIIAKQRKVAIVTEMIHTASLYDDDVLDRQEKKTVYAPLYPALDLKPLSIVK